jgi:hypothetical protein
MEQPSNLTVEIEIPELLEVLWDYKHKISFRSTINSKWIPIIEKLIALEDTTYKHLYHIQVIPPDEKSKVSKENGTYYVIWKRSEWETDIAKQDALKARGEAIQSWHNRRKELIAIVTKGIANYLQTTEDSDAVKIMVDTVIATKMTAICEQFGVPHADLSILFEPLPK